MSLWKYKYFVDVVDMKNFTKAGKKNFVTQTAISQQIASLEKEIGGKLISRDAGILEVTEFGQIVYDKATKMLHIHKQMEKELEQMRKKDVIRIGIDSSINKLLWRKMQDLIDAYYSEEDFQFSRIDGAVGSKMLEEHSLDIYIGYGINEGTREGDIEEFRFSGRPVGVYVGKNTTINIGEKVYLEDLTGYVRYGTEMYPCSVVDYDKSFYEICGDICYVDNVETMKLKVEFNNGYAFVDSYYFSQCVGDVYEVADWEYPQYMNVYYRKNKNKPKLRDVLEKLRRMAEET